MNPPTGTEWRQWISICPYCQCGFPTTSGLDFERLVRSHHCPEEDAA